MSKYSNLLHTKSDYAKKAEYGNMLSKGMKEQQNTSKIDEQINILQKQEIDFYQSILGEPGIENIEQFLKIVRIRTSTVKKCFDRLSSYAKQEGLFEYILKHISLNEDLSFSEKNKEDIDKLKQSGILNEQTSTASQLTEQFSIDLDLFLSQTDNLTIVFNAKGKGGKKKTQTVHIDRLLQDFKGKSEKVSLKKFDSEIAPLLEERLKKGFTNQKGDKIFEGLSEGIYSSVPQIIGSLRKAFISTLAIQEELLDNRTIEALIDQATGLKSQRSVLTKKSMSSTLENQEKVRKILLNYLTQGVEDSADFIKAFNKAWNKEDREGIINAIYKKGTTNFIGIMGEIGGLTLLHYLNKNADATIKWTGAINNIYGEQSRADIMYNAMGIQVKNYKKKSVQSTEVTTKLHPKELLERLSASNIWSEQKIAVEDLLSNMAFNEDIEKIQGYKEGLIQILQYYLGSTLNFNVTSEEKDASNLWLVGGNMVIPGSAILRAFKGKIQEGKNAKIKITFSEKRLSDIDYSEKTSGINLTAPLFTDYWRSYGKGENAWKPYNKGDTAGNEATRKNLLSSDKISIHTSFRFSELFNGTENLENNFAFL